MPSLFRPGRLGHEMLGCRMLLKLLSRGHGAGHLYSGAATIILASCGSSGNSAIMAPTCGRAARHGTERQMCLFQRLMSWVELAI